MVEMRTSFPALLLGMATVLLAAGCTSAPRGAGRAPTVAPVRRIVSLAPSATEVLFALGAGPQVVACTQSCTYPPEARLLPRVGDMHIDLERVVAAAPDLVVAEWLTSSDVTRRLSALGLTVFQGESATLAGYLDTLRRLGQATGHADAAARLGEGLQRQVGHLRERLRHRPLNRRPRVFVEIWSRPLQTAATGTFIDELVGLAGGINVFHDLEQYPQVSAEALVLRDPDVVLLTSTSPDEFAAHPAFRGLRAVTRRRVFAVDPDTVSRPGPRLSQALDRLTEILRP